MPKKRILKITRLTRTSHCEEFLVDCGMEKKPDSLWDFSITLIQERENHCRIILIKHSEIDEDTLFEAVDELRESFGYLSKAYMSIATDIGGKGDVSLEEI